MGEGNRLSEFEARLLALKHAMERGLAERARTLRELSARVQAGDAAARKLLKTESHKLRGVAGSYGHHDLTELASELEQRASVSPPATVGRLAHALADLAEQKAKQSEPPDPAQAPQAPARKTPSNRPKPEPTGERLRVLAIDDDPVTQRLLSLTLEQVGGFEATIVHSAKEALALLATEPFSLVVSDAMMPDMNGREFRRAARAAGATMPIVILSAASAAELGWTSELDASDAWLRKPFRPTELVQELRRIVSQHRGG